MFSKSLEIGRYLQYMYFDRFERDLLKNVVDFLEKVKSSLKGVCLLHFDP